MHQTGLNTFHVLPILSTQQPHLIGTLTIVSTWLTRKLKFRGVNLPKFPQRWGSRDKIKLSILTLDTHELSNKGGDRPRITSTTDGAKVPADLKVHNSFPILDHLPSPWLFTQTTHLGLPTVTKWHVCSCFTSLAGLQVPSGQVTCFRNFSIPLDPNKVPQTRGCLCTID